MARKHSDLLHNSWLRQHAAEAVERLRQQGDPLHALCDRAGLRVDTVSRWLNGKTQLGDVRLCRFLDVLGTSLRATRWRPRSTWSLADGEVLWCGRLPDGHVVTVVDTANPGEEHLTHWMPLPTPPRSGT